MYYYLNTIQTLRKKIIIKSLTIKKPINVKVSVSKILCIIQLQAYGAGFKKTKQRCLIFMLKHIIPGNLQLFAFERSFKLKSRKKLLLRI